MGLLLPIFILRQLLYQYFQPVFYNFPRTRAFKYQWLDELFLPAHCGNIAILSKFYTIINFPGA